MSNTAVSTEPRGIAAAMSQPVFTPKMGQSALGAADRATRRWAPESTEDQPRGMRSLSFVDRMVAPWVTAAQRSAGLRMFSQYASSETPERAITGVSWVFPRPWYQDELDWIAASRANQAGHDMIFTTRGTYAQAADRRRETMPPQMLEYVAPSFASSSPEAASAYSPLVSHSSYSALSVVAQSMQAIQTASAMARGLPVRSIDAAGAMAPASAMTPAMGASFGSLAPLVSSLIPDGDSARFSTSSSALSLRAPQLVTPPSPRGEDDGAVESTQQQAGEHAVQAARSEREAQVARAAAEVSARQEQSRAMAVTFAQERERVAEQMRVQARSERERATAVSMETPVAAPSTPSQTEVAAREAFRAEAIRIEAARVERTNVSRVQSSARQQARIDAIVAERMARLESAAPVSSSEAPVAESAPSVSSSSSVAAAQPSEAQSQAMVQALRMAELLAHAAAIGPSAMAPAAGPRMAMPSGLGGLVAGMNTVAVIQRERTMAQEPMARRENAPLPFASAFQPVFAAPFATAEASVAAANDEQRTIDTSAPAMARAAAPMIPPVAAWAPRAIAPEAMRADSALGAIASSSPAALGHVAWADRWLGRFAGASEAALDAMSTISMRARLAPTQSFLAPTEGPRAETPAFEAPSRFSAPSLDVVAPRRADAASAAPSVAQQATRVEVARAEAAQAEAARIEVARAEAARVEASRSQPSALRFADDDVVSDDVFAAIAAAAPPRRAAPSAAVPGAKAVAKPAAPSLPPQQFARMPQLTAADMVALTAPSAPVDAGLSASLAASPMAPALGHVLALPRTAVFDTRSLGGAELAAAFLAGSVSAPMVAQYGGAASAAGRIGSFGGVTSPLWSNAAEAGDEVSGPSLWRQWSAELVRPAEQTRAASGREDVRFDGRADSSFDSVISSAQRPVATPAASEVASFNAAAANAAANAAAAASAVTANENIITLRSTLLAPASPRQQRLAASAGTVASWANQEAIDSLPVAYQTLGELLQEASPDSRWLSSMSNLAPMSSMSALPGSAAEAAVASQSWDSMAAPPRFDQGFPLVFWPLANAPATASFVERFAEATSAPYAQAPTAAAPRGARSAAPQVASAAADFDASIMTPALVEQGLPGTMDRGALSPGMLAQRALGFGAVQSSQSADLSFDFVPPELVLAARVYGFGPAEAAQAARLAMGGSTGLSAMAGAVDLRFVSLMGPAAPGQGRPDLRDGREAREEARTFSSSSAPSDNVRSQEGAREQDAFGVARRTPRGAFLLPSASVAAMGLSAALPEGEHSMSIAALEVLAAKMVAELGSFASPALFAAAAGEVGGTVAGPSARRAPSTTMVDLSQPRLSADSVEASEAEVLSSAATSISASRRARFESLYVALAESSSGRTMTPAARAARALALANRDEDSTALSSRERAALAWQIFPVVLNGEATPGEAAAAGEVREQRGSSAQRGRIDLPTVAAISPADRPGAEMRPGLSPLSSRAGEALSSFVTAAPSAGSAAGSSSSESRSSGSSAWRSGRYGGGEVEIPGWFEAAARKMFEDRGEIEGISLSELTLVASTPPSQIAASDRASSPAAAPKQASPDGKGEKGQKVDVESVAADVYRAVMQMMESARMRNGEPFL